MCMYHTGESYTSTLHQNRAIERVIFRFFFSILFAHPGVNQDWIGFNASCRVSNDNFLTHMCVVGHHTNDKTPFVRVCMTAFNLALILVCRHFFPPNHLGMHASMLAPERAVSNIYVTARYIHKKRPMVQAVSVPCGHRRDMHKSLTVRILASTHHIHRVTLDHSTQLASLPLQADTQT